MIQKVLIVGASGLIGSNFAYHLRRHYRVFGTYHYRIPRIDNVIYFRFGLSAAAPIREFIRVIRPDAIIFCAAITDLAACEKDPSKIAFVNSVAPASFASAAAEYGCRFIFLSSAKLFSGEEGNY